MATYTDTQRTEAVTLYQQAGGSEASRQLGIPRRTILDWAKASGVVAQADQEKTTEARAVAAERVTTAWADYRSREATAAGATASRARQSLLRLIDADEGRAAQSMAVTYGILIDKAELLSGNATERIETWASSELDRSLRELVDEMEEVIRNERRP